MMIVDDPRDYGKWLPWSYDPVTRKTVSFCENEDGTILWHTETVVDQLVEENKASFNDSDGKRWGDGKVIASIDLPTYDAQLGYPLFTGAYGQLASETPAAADMPVAFPKPSTDEGTHLSYSLQWFAFGVLMFVGFGYAARQQARNAAIDAEDDEEAFADGAVHSAVPAARRRPAPPRKRTKATAEEEEDALLDAQGF